MAKRLLRCSSFWRIGLARQRYKEGDRQPELMPEKDKLVIWPIYFDASRSRDEGRMVPIHDAVADPSLDMLITAAIRSGFKPEIEREKRHPKTWHVEGAAGRILIARAGPKSSALKRIAPAMKAKFKKKGKN